MNPFLTCCPGLLASKHNPAAFWARTGAMPIRGKGCFPLVDLWLVICQWQQNAHLIWKENDWTTIEHSLSHVGRPSIFRAQTEQLMWLSESCSGILRA